MANKKITELTLVDEITEDLNFPVDDTLQTYRATIAQVKAFLAPIYVPPSKESYLSSSGTHKKHYTFICGSASATVGATYTNNGVTFTVVRTISSKTQVVLSGDGAPTASGSLSKASGTGDSTITFSSVRTPIALKVKLIGAGGGGGGSSDNGTGGTGGTGGNTTFGTSLLGAGGGVGGGNPGPGGGGAILNSSGFGVALSGGSGQGGAYNSANTTIVIHSMGGQGAAGPFGGVGAGADIISAGGTGIAAIANTGSGGGGAACPNFQGKGGGGGGAGAFIDMTIYDLLDSYSYAVGAGGTAGTAGTNGFAGGAGGSGRIDLEYIYQ